MWQDQLLAEAVQHSLAIIATAELERRRTYQCANMSAEALGGRVVEVIGDIRDR